MNETWKTIADYQAYEISDQGRVRSKARLVRAYHHGRESLRQLRERILQPFKDKDGYLVVNIQRPGNRLSIHRLVAEEFIGQIDSNETVNHKNGNKADNRPENLEYLSVIDNVLHAHRTGLMPQTRHLCGIAS